MITFPTKQLILEGPDLVGKTTLYNSLHQATYYKWNIQDRSSLSMLCYARLYGRNPDAHRIRLQEELNDLNNRMIILLPPLSVIEERYHERGDDLQSLESLRRLYTIFSEEATLIQHRPTVMCIREEKSVETLLNYTDEWSYALESCLPEHVGEVIKDTLHASRDNEMMLRAKMIYVTGAPASDILAHDSEGEYYTQILSQLEEVIQNELDGKNPYKKPQTLESRRFIYNSDTCISNIHFMPRGTTLNAIVSLRSTDVDRNASIDLKFLEFLTQYINRKFKFFCNTVCLDVTLNSAHIRIDLEE